MAPHRWERFLRVSFSMFLIFCQFFCDHIFGISTIDFIEKDSTNVQFLGPLRLLFEVKLKIKNRAVCKNCNTFIIRKKINLYFI